MTSLGKAIAILGLAGAAAVAASADALACASCGCSLSTDWQSLDYSFKPGLKLDVRYDFLDQNQLRHGTGTISPAAASQIVNNGMPQEVEKYTENHYITVGLDYSHDEDWGLNVQLPYIIRMHSTLGMASDGSVAGPGGGQYDSRTASVGDMKIIGRYQGFTAKHNLGLLLGLKLPTGSYSDAANSTDPTAPGLVPIDRGLQPGTGTTDVIGGFYYNDAITPSWGYFTQFQYQYPLYSTAGYRPGNILKASVGLRYVGLDYVAPQLQLNLSDLQRDTGPNADRISTGGTLLYVSPGLVAAVSDRVSLYGFVEFPVYQDVTGVQLTPRFITTVGARYAF